MTLSPLQAGRGRGAGGYADASARRIPGLALEQAGKGAFGHAEARAPFADRFRESGSLRRAVHRATRRRSRGMGRKAHFGEQGELVEQDGNHPGHGAGLLIVAGLRGECVDEFADEGETSMAW